MEAKNFLANLYQGRALANYVMCSLDIVVVTVLTHRIDLFIIRTPDKEFMPI